MIVNNFSGMTASRGSCLFHKLLQESPDAQFSEVAENNLPVYTVLMANRQIVHLFENYT